VVFGQGRTGSTLLASLLSSHPAVQCDGEILEAKVPDPVGHVASCEAASKKPVYGFKVKVYQLSDIQNINPGVFLRQMATAGAKLIFLTRRNLLRHALSNYIARANRYHFRRGEKVELEPIHFEPEELLEVMSRRARHRRNEEAAISGLDAHRMVYEDDLLAAVDQQRSLRCCFEFLGVPPRSVFTDYIRGVTGPLSRRISNYAEVAGALRGTPYEKFLDDSAYS